MSEAWRPRLFGSDAEIARLGEGLLGLDLAREDWTHEAHLAATSWLIECRPDVDLDRELPGIIRRFNESVGGVNDATQGYHETITRCFLAGVRLHRASLDPGLPLSEKVNRLLEAPQGRRDWPLLFYSRDLLFSTEARLAWVEPDLAPLPGPAFHGGVEPPQ